MNELVLPWPRPAASPPSFDLALAAAVAGLSLMDVWAPLSFVTREHHRPLLSVVFVGMSLALVWRRRVPLAVLAFVFTAGEGRQYRCRGVAARGLGGSPTWLSPSSTSPSGLCLVRWFVAGAAWT